MAIEHQVFAEVNQRRRSMSLPELNWDARVADVARQHAENMATRNFFAHDDPILGALGDRLAQKRISWRRYAENFYQAKGMPNPVQNAVRSWLNSKEHRMNMLNPDLTESGVGVALQDRKLFIVQDFITP